ncbi:DUF397 domain-containing protein [Lentzea aerocolonigenes]|uniref:DUF397 domain-containing protein n=1 Tax=Lentzea aerocolonigenes TaxID=68170 RepID=UPI0009DDEA70|nr:DUF397 domain-containing protein [Lentzea aerocolonigenes]MCP2243503.1 protein of unknown function (DUF397) [Lentzea aerocolonigenes]
MDQRDLQWKKANRSQGTNNCVELGCDAQGNIVAVRDSKNADGPQLPFSRAAMMALVNGGYAAQ